MLSDFGELSLDPESFWNGSDGSGYFISGPARFHNSYNSEYLSWSGWAYSSTSDVSTSGFANQYSAVTGEGFPGSDPLNQVYGVSCLYGPSVIDFSAEQAHVIKGFYTTNSTYAALSMREGDFFAKKFGGDSGSDPDYFKLLVWGKLDGAFTDTIEYYLADYRYENANDDYIINTWQWVDLSSLGRVDSLLFGLESSDAGDYGINTPAYFCLDNLMVALDYSSGMGEDPEPGVLIYPNPSCGQFIVESEDGGILEVSVYSMTGSLIYSNRKFVSGRTIDLGGLAASYYIVRIKNYKGVNNKLILIK
jgi:hypothetical protein